MKHDPASMIGLLILISGIVPPAQAQEEKPVASIFRPSQVELVSRVRNSLTFSGREIPSGGGASPSNISDILGRRALPAGIPSAAALLAWSTGRRAPENLSPTFGLGARALPNLRNELRAPAAVPALDVGAPTQQPAQRPTEPEHTGLAAIVYKTAADFKAFPRRRSTWVILALGGATAALAHPVDDKVNGRLVGSRTVGRFFAPGKWIGSTWVQGSTAIGLYAIGRYMLPHTEGESKTNKVSHLGFDLLRAALVSQALTQGIKITVRRDRPTGECCAFPSGHASTTFATAAVLERHLGYRAAWPTLVIATYVGASRLHDNRHFLSDVLFGASLGMASGWTVVGRHGRSDYSLMPVPVHGGVMIALSRIPRQAAP